MAKVSVVTFADWNHAPWRDELDTAVADYLRRSREEITNAEEWTVLSHAMLGQGNIVLLVALDDAGEHVQGFTTLRAIGGTQVTGTIVQIWQAYVWPGRARLMDLFTDAFPLMEQWAKQYGATRFTLSTRRMTRAYARLLKRIGFKMYMVTYDREVSP